MKTEINKVINYILYINYKFITLCKTQDTPMKTFKHFVIVNFLQCIGLYTFCVSADKLYVLNFLIDI